MKRLRRRLAFWLVVCLCIGINPVKARADFTIYWPLSTEYGISNSFSEHPARDGVDMRTNGKTPEVYAVADGTAYFYQVQAKIDGSDYLVSYGNLV